jgi:hypothetical protein
MKKLLAFTAVVSIITLSACRNKITLSGYIKTENVIEGRVGISMAIQPIIAFGHTYIDITGTNDWTKHEVSLDMYPDKAEKIIVAGSFSGIVFTQLDEQKINDLELLGRIWGFLKRRADWKQATSLPILTGKVWNPSWTVLRNTIRHQTRRQE